MKERSDLDDELRDYSTSRDVYCVNVIIRAMNACLFAFASARSFRV
jgi:hypothetical protein